MIKNLYESHIKCGQNLEVVVLFLEVTMIQRNRKTNITLFIVTTIVVIIFLILFFLHNDHLWNEDTHKLSAVNDLTSGNIKAIQLEKGDEEYIYYRDDDSILRVSNLSSTDDSEVTCSITIMKMWQGKNIYLLKPVFRADLKGIIVEGELIPEYFSVIPCNSGFETMEIHENNTEKLIEDSGIIGNLDVEWYNSSFAIKDTTKIQVRMILKDIQTKRFEVTISALT